MTYSDGENPGEKSGSTVPPGDKIVTNIVTVKTLVKNREVLYPPVIREWHIISDNLLKNCTLFSQRDQGFIDPGVICAMAKLGLQISILQSVMALFGHGVTPAYFFLERAPSLSWDPKINRSLRNSRKSRVFHSGMWLMGFGNHLSNSCDGASGSIENHGGLKLEGWLSASPIKFGCQFELEVLTIRKFHRMQLFQGRWTQLRFMTQCARQRCSHRCFLTCGFGVVMSKARVTQIS